MSDMRFTNAAEQTRFAKVQMAEADRAVWDGREAFMKGLDGIQDNPYMGWQESTMKQHGHQCLLWCRWLLGWLREHERSRSCGAVTGSVIKRVSQGDCPTEPAHSVETLEEALIEVNRLFQAEQKVPLYPTGDE